MAGEDPGGVTNATGTLLCEDLRLNQEKPIPAISAPANASTTHSGGCGSIAAWTEGRDWAQGDQRLLEQIHRG